MLRALKQSKRKMWPEERLCWWAGQRIPKEENVEQFRMFPLRPVHWNVVVTCWYSISRASVKQLRLQMAE